MIDDDRLALPLIERAAKYGKVIAFHIGADFYENTHPYRLQRIARLFPETRFILIHLGGAGLPPLDRAAVEVLQSCPNVIAIGSGINELPILRALQQAGTERILLRQRHALWPGARASGDVPRPAARFLYSRPGEGVGREYRPAFSVYENLCP